MSSHLKRLLDSNASSSLRSANACSTIDMEECVEEEEMGLDPERINELEAEDSNAMATEYLEHLNPEEDDDS